MRKTLLWSTLVVLCIGVLLCARWTTSLVRTARTQSLPVVPYTLEFQTVEFSSDGVPSLGERRTVAVRADGSESWTGEWPGKKGQTIRKLLRRDGYVSTVIESIRAKMSAATGRDLAKIKAERAAAASNGCVYAGEEPGGAETILGVKVGVASVSSKDLRVTSWRAVDFGCAVIKSRRERLVGGRWRPVIESVPLSFVPGEPSAALFDERSSLDEVPPSEVLRRLAARDGVTAQQCPECFDATKLASLDRRHIGQGRPD